MPSAGRGARVAASILALLAGATAWLSGATLAVTGGDAQRVAALPSISWLAAAMVAAVAAAYVTRLRLADAWPLAISFLIWLPFVPGPIPHAFLLWQGPIEGVVWAVVIVGLLSTRAIRVPAVFSDPMRAPRIAALSAATLALVAFNHVRAVVPSGDEPHYLAATQSLIADRDLKVENNYTRGDYLQYFNGRLQPHYLQRSAAGEIYSIHAPGVSVIVLPAFLVGGYVGAVLTVVALAGVTAMLTWMLAWRLSKSAPAAWIGLGAVFATAPFLFHAFTIYPDGIGALSVMIGMWLIVRLLDNEVPSQPHLAAVGAAIAVLPWLHTRFALIAAAMGAVIVAQLATKPIRPTRIAAFLAVPIVAAAAWFAYFWIIWGTPNPLAPYGRDTSSSLSYIRRGLVGLFFDQQFGLISTAPIYAVAVAGLWALIRQRARLAVALAVIVVPYVIGVSTYAMWWGGTSAPARFLATVLPLAALAIACAWTRYPRLRIVTALLWLVSIALVVPRLTQDGGRLVFQGGDVVDATIQWMSPNVDLGFALPSVHRDVAEKALADATLWLLPILGMCGAAATVHTRRWGHGAAWTIVALSGASVVMLLTNASSLTPRRSILAALRGERSWHQHFVDVPRFAPISHEAFRDRLALDTEPALRDASLLRVAHVPAGDYQVEATDGATRADVTINVHRTDQPLESAATPFRLSLPVAVSSLSIRTTGQAPTRVRPVVVTTALNADGREAIRAVRYGRARVFFFDERAYPEPTGFWTRGEGRVTLVIDADETARRAGLPITFTGGGAATTIGISVGEWSQSYSLTPGERRSFTLPPLANERAWILDIHSGPGARPFQREPGNPDVRLLAAWFEIP